MQIVNAHELVNNLLMVQEAASPERNLFLSGFSLKGENEFMRGEIDNIFIRPDFTLNITKVQFEQDVELITPFPAQIVGFTFCTQGESTFLIPQENAPLRFCDGMATFYKTPPHEGRARFTKGMNYTSLAIHITADKFLSIIGNELSSLPTEFQEVLHTDGHVLYSREYDSRIRTLLNDLCGTELKGLSRQFFIESKVLEIISLMIDTVCSPNENISNISTLDIEKIRECEALLRENFSTPPSLLELAKMVGLNDFKLKQGFKAVYGKPVFKYLQEYRLNMARQALEKKPMTVGEVAETIGYTSLGSFSNAFFNQFGFRPGDIKSVSNKN